MWLEESLVLWKMAWETFSKNLSVGFDMKGMLRNLENPLLVLKYALKD
jgi:hypothetical protein